MLGKFRQPPRIQSKEHLEHTLPLIELDREWDDLRQKTHIYLVIAYGFSLLTCFSTMSNLTNSIDSEVSDAISRVTPWFAFGLMMSSFSFVVYLFSAWTTMRNRKRIFAGEDYFIGWTEAVSSQISGILGGLSAVLFSGIIAYGLFSIL